MSTAELPAFEWFDLKGRHYRIFESGRVEGFEDMVPCCVVNRIPLLQGRAITEALERLPK